MLPQDSEQTSHRRKQSKRRIDSDEERDEDGDSDPLNISPTKLHPTPKKKRVSEAQQDRLGTPAWEVTEADTPSQSKTCESTPPPSKLEKGDGMIKKAKKKRPLVESEDEDESKFIRGDQDYTYQPPRSNEDEEEERGYEQKRPEATVKQKAAPRRRPTKGVNMDSAAKGRRGKVKETKEIIVKNEGLSQAQNNTANPNMRTQLKELPNEVTDAVDVVSDPSAANTLEPPRVQTTETAEVVNEPPQPQPQQPLPVKRKLPTIRKTKAPLTTVPLTPVGPKSMGAPSRHDGDEMGKFSAVEARVAPANVGSADFDLRKPSVYAELFKSAGGSTPRSGLNRRDKDEERRRELDRMRDEARAKRTVEASPAFDLQAQWDKISRFEERLRQEKSSVLYPNFLAAKFKDDWERRRRKDHDKDSTKKVHSREHRPKEEGVTSHSWI